MATVTVTSAITITRNATSSASPTSSQRANNQAGVIEHVNPADYDPKNPIILFIIQAGIIIIFCRLLHWPLSKIRQPRVIAEVIGGVLLGPSVMGRIPGFSQSIFPQASMPNLNLAANLGLVLFLFLVGLEVDLRYLVKHWRVAVTVGLAGMALPFGLGCAIAYGLYHAFRLEPGTTHIDFPVYMLFIGVAMAITAFPVLCRILTELKLLHTPVGVIVLAAGVGNDVVGWVLLALCVALVNSGSGITALYVLLACAGWVLFLVYAVRPAFMIILKRTRSIEDGPTQSVIALTILLVLTSSFFTGIIGVHPIFGAFLAGLICPHEGGFAIRVTEKIEDLVSTLLLPLYFALSGLSTNLGLLDSGKTWGYVFGVIVVAFFAKVIGGSGAARLNGLIWRECFTIGSLMSCKGLVELIVLNIGLQAKILSQRTFTIFVVMALVTTFATTPLVSVLYPPWYQKKLEAWKRGEIDWDTGRRRDSLDEDSQNSVQTEKLDAAPLRKFLFFLRLDSLPTTLAVIALLSGGNDQRPGDEHDEPTATESGGVSHQRSIITAHGLRLLQLTERDSSVMQVSEESELTPHDPVIGTFVASGTLYNIPTTGEVAISPEYYYASALSNKAHECSSDFMLLPWSENGSLSDGATVSNEESKTKLASSPLSSFVQQSFETAAESTNVGVLVNNGIMGTVAEGFNTLRNGLKIVVPFFGTPDDRLAVRLALQLVKSRAVHVVIQNIQHSQEAALDVQQIDEKSPHSTTFERGSAFLEALKASLAPAISDRVELVDGIDAREQISTFDLVDSIAGKLAKDSEGNNQLLLVGRNAREISARPTSSERLASSDLTTCLGHFADRVLIHQSKTGKGMSVDSRSLSSLLVVQARRT